MEITSNAFRKFTYSSGLLFLFLTLLFPLSNLTRRTTFLHVTLRYLKGHLVSVLGSVTTTHRVALHYLEATFCFSVESCDHYPTCGSALLGGDILFQC
jgi:cytochrome c biogenesis protein CcdA